MKKDKSEFIYFEKQSLSWVIILMTVLTFITLLITNHINSTSLIIVLSICSFPLIIGFLFYNLFIKVTTTTITIGFGKCIQEVTINLLWSS